MVYLISYPYYIYIYIYTYTHTHTRSLEDAERAEEGDVDDAGRHHGDEKHQESVEADDLGIRYRGVQWEVGAVDGG